MRKRERNAIKAFALLEIALALAVLGIINHMGVKAFGEFTRRQRTKVTANRQEQVTLALKNYALVHGKLPCPAENASGKARLVCETAAEAVGYIPYKTLSIPEDLARDGAHRHMSYAVNTALTSKWLARPERIANDPSPNPSRTFRGIAGADTLVVKDENGDDCATAPDFVALAIIAHGDSGGYYLENGQIQPYKGTDREKIANSSRSGTYFAKSERSKGEATFDDRLLFVSRNNLMGGSPEAREKR